MREDFDVVIGLEVHAELKTNTKVFCSCENKFGNEPNTNCCPNCIGLPGSLPVLNKKAVELTIKAGICMGCRIIDVAVFDRKNYFYPDLSKAYQISQLEKPICIGGGIDLDNGKHIRLNRIHLEEDAGKLVHKNQAIGTIVDYNRGGVPLIEMVSEPDISSAEEAIEFLMKLRNNLIFADIADCRMEQGGMRCDVNLSVKRKGSTELGTRTEMKNLNSFKSVERAIEYETARQIEVVENGGKVEQQTRKWDDEKGKSFALRSKESSQDYRYFPDPDLLAVKISRELVRRLQNEIPSLPTERKKKYIENFNLSEYDSNILISEKNISNFFDACVEKYNEPKKVANWIITELLKYCSKQGDDFCVPMQVEQFVDILKMYYSKKISQNNAKALFELCIGNKEDALQLAKNNNMLSDLSDAEIENIIIEIVEANPKAKEDYKVNKEKVTPFFFGQVMKATKGKANADIVRKLLTKYLG